MDFIDTNLFDTNLMDLMNTNFMDTNRMDTNRMDSNIIDDMAALPFSVDADLNSTYQFLQQTINMDTGSSKHLTTTMIHLLRYPPFRKVYLAHKHKTLDYYNIVKDVKILNGNEVYRIGDALKDNKKLTKSLKHKRYRDTILGKYVQTRVTRSHCNESDNLQSLAMEIKAYSIAFDVATDDLTLYIHFRTGDIQPVSIGQVVDKARAYLVEESTITSIVIVTALHFGVSIFRSSYKSHDSIVHTYEAKLPTILSRFDNIFNMVRLLREVVPNVSIISNTNVDIDLCILSRCKHLLVTKGGFSTACSKLNMILNNRDVQPKYTTVI